MRRQVDVQSIETKLNTSFGFKGVHVNPLIYVSSRDQISMKFCIIC